MVRTEDSVRHFLSEQSLTSPLHPSPRLAVRHRLPHPCLTTSNALRKAPSQIKGGSMQDTRRMTRGGDDSNSTKRD